MDHAVHSYFVNSLAPSTLALYRSASHRYITFCGQLNLSPLPVSQETVVRFVAYLAQSNLSYQSIRTYLSGIRFMQIACGLPDPQIRSFPVLDYVLRGIHRVIPTSPRQARHPITPEILGLLHAAWSHPTDISQADATMLWAACCTGFFGFLRAGEFPCSSWNVYTQEMLSFRDVSVDSHHTPSLISIRLRRSKSDPFGNGVTVHLGSTGHAICPVAALLGYLAQRGQGQGPLFLFQNGSPLSKVKLMQHLREALGAAGVDTSGLRGHSFRIGAATAAAAAGLEDSLIQTLGRWHSSTFLRYIRTPAHALAASSARLLECNGPPTPTQVSPLPSTSQ